MVGGRRGRLNERHLLGREEKGAGRVEKWGSARCPHAKMQVAGVG